ncbi:hypothetical protein LXL04_014330 [Taraxacum kok-saghyz]
MCFGDFRRRGDFRRVDFRRQATLRRYSSTPTHRCVPLSLCRCVPPATTSSFLPFLTGEAWSHTRCSMKCVREGIEGLSFCRVCLANIMDTRNSKPLPAEEEKEVKETLQQIPCKGKKVFDMSIKTRAKKMERFLRDPINFDA